MDLRVGGASCTGSAADENPIIDAKYYLDFKFLLFLD